MEMFGFAFYILFFTLLGLSILLYVIFFYFNQAQKKKSSTVNFGNYRLRESVLTKNEMAFYGTAMVTVMVVVSGTPAVSST